MNQNQITNYLTPQPKRKAEYEVEEANLDDEMLSVSEQRNPRKTRKRENNASHRQFKQRQALYDNNRYEDLIDNDNEIDGSQILTKKPTALPPIVITQKLVNIKSSFQTIKSWGSKVHFKTIHNSCTYIY